MKAEKNRIKKRNLIGTILIICILLCFTGCENNTGNSIKDTDTYIYTESDNESVSFPEKENSKKSGSEKQESPETKNNAVSEKSGSSETESIEVSENSESSETESIDVSENSESSKQKKSNNSDESSEMSQEEEETSAISAEVSFVIQKYTTEGGVLDLHNMLMDGFGLEDAQFGMYGDKYSIAFSYNAFTREEVPGAVFLYTRDGFMHYQRNADSSGNIAALFRNIDIIMSEEDILAIYNAFVNNDISGFYEI